MIQLLPRAFNPKNEILYKLINPIQICIIWLRGFSSLGSLFLLLVLFNMGDEVKQILLWIGGGRGLGIVGGMRGRAARRVERERDRLRMREIRGGVGMGMGIGGIHARNIGVNQHPLEVPVEPEILANVHPIQGQNNLRQPPPPPLLPPTAAAVAADDGYVPGMYARSSHDRAADYRAADIMRANAVRVAIAAHAHAAVMKAFNPEHNPTIHPPPVGEAAEADDDDDDELPADIPLDENINELAEYIEGIVATCRIFIEGLSEDRWDDVQIKSLDCLWIGLIRPALLIILKNALFSVCKFIFIPRHH